MQFQNLAAICNGKLNESDYADKYFEGVSIDSRSINNGQLFIAIKGEFHDGHDYVNQAIQNGASGLLVDQPNTDVESKPIVIVDDSFEAMHRLAAEHRQQLDAHFIAITGSNGKTTTKELTAQLIKAVEEKTYHSPGNLNNLFGLPLSMFSVGEDAKVVVLELGISTVDEMPKLTKLVKPDLVVITNVGASHLEFLSSHEAVAHAKLDLVRNSAPDIPIIVNADDKLLLAETKKIRPDCLTFALDRAANFVPDKIEYDNQGNSLITIDNNKFILPLLGRHQIYNFTAAYAVFKTLGYDFKNVDTEKIALSSAPLRGEITEASAITFVLDCYNANPDSMQAGLDAFFNLPTDKRRVLILGDMLELGDSSIDYHRTVGKQITNYDFDLLVAVGEMSAFMIDELKKMNPETITVHFDDVEKACAEINNYLKPNDLVYLKGSRGIALERIYNLYREEVK